MSASSGFKVVLHIGDSSKGAELQVQTSWTLPQFKKKASEKLKVTVKRVFLPNGAEVTGCDEMSANQNVYVTSGEDFRPSHALNTNNGNGGAAGSPNRSAGPGGGEKLFISVLGTGGVGKSALSLRFVRDYFVEGWDPTIEDAYSKSLEVDDKPCVIDILDTAGQDDFESLRTSWMIDKDGYMFVYSLDHPQSLEELKPFFDLHAQINERRKVAIVLAANKKDLVAGDKALAAREAGMARARELGAKYVETSAFNGENVQEAFESLIRMIRENKKRAKKNNSGGDGGITPVNARDEGGGRGGCCDVM